MLLGTGCFPVDVRDCSDKTPLHYAALNGADEVFQVSSITQAVLLIEESDYLVASQLGLFVAAAGPEQG